MTEFIWFDYALLVIIVVSGVISLFRGFIKEAVSLLSWIAAVWVVWLFAEQFAEVLAPWLKDPVVRLWGARVILFLFVLLLGSLVGTGLAMLFNEGGLSVANRAFGIVFGAARGIVLCCVLISVLEMIGFSRSPWWQESKLIPYAAPITDQLRKLASDGLDYIDDVGIPPAPEVLPEGSGA